MVQTRYIHFRVNTDEFAKIKENARLEGKKSVSEYMRELALSRGPNMWNKVVETHSMVKDLCVEPELKNAFKRLEGSVESAELRLRTIFRDLEIKAKEHEQKYGRT